MSSALPSGTLCYGFVASPVARPSRSRLLGPGAVLSGPGLTILRLLGQGGMGEVYEAEHPELGRRFAVKVLHRELRGRPDLAARLAEEARTLARVQHPNIVQVLDLGLCEDGRPYFAMELLTGRNLREEIARRGPFPVAEALLLLEQALAALGAIHAAGVIHRDVKLENLVLGEDGALKLVDFGVSRPDQRSASFRTAADAIVGTPRTMAPEQCAPGLPVDARADLYAAGLVLYELLTGRGPFDDLRGYPDAFRFAHCDRTPPPPSRFAPRPVPPPVERLILRALEKDPARRFQSAEEMASASRAARIALDDTTEPADLTPTTAWWPLTPPLDAAPTLLDELLDASATVPFPMRPAPRTGRSARAPHRPRARRAPRSALRRTRRTLLSLAPPSWPASPIRGAALGLCALVLASVALALSLAGRPPSSPSSGKTPVDAIVRAAVR